MKLFYPIPSYPLLHTLFLCQINYSIVSLRQKTISIAWLTAILVSSLTTILGHPETSIHYPILLPQLAPSLEEVSEPQNTPPTTLIADSTSAPPDSIRYPLEDPAGDFVTTPNNNPFDFDTPTGIEQKIEYDPETGQYVITETIGGKPYRYPTYLSFEEYLQFREQQSLTDFMQQRSNSQSLIEGQGLIPKLYTGSELIETIFGGNGVDIRPRGSVTLEMGIQTQRTDNPNIPVNLRRNITPRFDMAIDMGLDAKIGDALNLNLNYNTTQIFDFNNQIKLEYVGDEDDIIQEVRAGNVNFPLPTTLIPGYQNLFGIQTKLKFGRLTINSVLSQQRSRNRNITLENGAQVQEFEVRGDQYDWNRNYFLSHYFRNNYEQWVCTVPHISSPITITRLDVYVSDRRGTPQDPQRDIAALADLGETDPNKIVNPTITVRQPNGLPSNNGNSLKDLLATGKDNRARELDESITELKTRYQLQDVRDFRQVRTRKLEPNEYTYDPQLGFVSLNYRLNDNDVLAVAYEYVDSRTGDKFRVGEFSEDIFPVDSLAEPKIVFLKMLKSTQLIPTEPIWDLMMKNVYSLGAFQVEKEDFTLDIFYDSPKGGNLRYIPEGDGIEKVPLINLLNVDNLNIVQETQSDGIFDFVPTQRYVSTESTRSQNAYTYGTINVRNGRVVFPVLEPFGDHLRRQFEDKGDNTEQLINEYVYDVLYDSTRTVTLEFPERNRFILKGSYKSNISSEISLGAFNIPPGSVRVTAGGQILQEGVDYTINYSLGRISILNDGYLQSGQPINVSFEDNGAFGLQQKTFMGSRLDFAVNRNFNIGGTLVRLSERPFTQKVNYGDDPIKNVMMGLDMNYFSETPWLTRALDKLPLYSTKEPSSITFNAEAATLLPGHHRSVNIDGGGSIYLDDFEGSTTEFPLHVSPTLWSLSSTPEGTVNEFGRELFPEARLNNDLRTGYNRASVSWYRVDNSFAGGRGGLDFSEDVVEQGRNNPYFRQVPISELFPNRPTGLGANAGNLPILNITYNPKERGPYNFDTDPTDISAGLEGDGELRSPETRWGGLMRTLPFQDFEAANVDFIEFWLLDPFITNPNNSGQLYLQLGTVSEDVLKDGRQFYEHALPAPSESTPLDQTVWGQVPRIRPVTNAFDNDDAARLAQDIGYDGLIDSLEVVQFEDYINFIQILSNNVIPGTDAAERFRQILADPSGDNYRFFNHAYYDSIGANIAQRYQRIRFPDGNSNVEERDDPLIDQPTTGTVNNSSTGFPDTEDLNQDRSLERTEAYFQYQIPLDQKNEPIMRIGEGYIADIVNVSDSTSNPNLPDSMRWYYYRIPIDEFSHKVGNISERNIQSLRLVMTGFQDTVTLRMTEFNLVRNNWREYEQIILENGPYLPNDNISGSFFNLTSINIEENSGRLPISYNIPEGIQRENLPSGIGGQNIQQNEQSMVLQVGNLQDGHARGAYRNMEVDMRLFKRLRMFVHAEALNNVEVCSNSFVNDGDLTAFIRLGDDFQDNYYEYEIPLRVTQTETPDGENISRINNPELLWPEENNIDLRIQDLVDTKLARNFDPNASFSKPFTRRIPVAWDTTRFTRITVVGSPDLGKTRQIMLGVRNPLRQQINQEYDDGLRKCAEIWFNELRLAQFDEAPGYAALASMNVKLADLGTATLTGNYHSAGFGTLEQRIVERTRDNLVEYNASTNLELGKFLPEKTGVSIPMYAGISQSISTPQYDPYDTDVKMKQRLDSIRLFHGTDSARLDRKQRQTATKIKSFNLTNVRKNRTNTERKPKPWDIENVNVTYSYTNTESRDPIIEQNKEVRHFTALGYTYSTRAKELYPFKKMIKSNSGYLKLLKDFNFNPIPTQFSFATDVERLRQRTLLRNLSDDTGNPDPLFNRYLFWNRNYNLGYQPFRSVNFNFNANVASTVDELHIDSILVRKQRETENPNLSRRSLQLSDTRASLGDFVDRNRNTSYNQSASISYNLPLDKIPFLDWTTVRTSYNTTYQWTANQSLSPVSNAKLRGINDPFLVQTLGDTTIAEIAGHTISNSRTIQFDTEFALDRLYRKSAFLNSITSNRPSRKRPQNPAANGGKAKRTGEASPFLKALLKPILSLRRVSIRYSDDNKTLLPGFLPSASFVGNNWNANGRPGGAPGLGFIFGLQPDRNWLNQAASDRIISLDTLQNQQLTQTVNRQLSLQANLEPISDLRVDINMNIDFNKTQREFLRAGGVDANGNPVLDQINFDPIREGGLSISFLSLKSLFGSIDSLNIQRTFKTFEDHRSIISRRLGAANPESEGSFTDTLGREYALGYGPTSNDVLVPAFIAAYTGRDPEKVSFNPFSLFPLPNWRVTYNGLSKLPLMKKLFSAFTIEHGYNSTFTINNFTSDLDFYREVPIRTPDGTIIGFRGSGTRDIQNNFVDNFIVREDWGVPVGIDTITGNFFTLYRIPNISIAEQLAPLAGINFTMVNGLTGQFSYTKARTLSMSFVDFELSETNTTQFTIGMGYQFKNGIDLPFKFRGKKISLDNELVVNFTLSYNNTLTTNYRLDQNVSENTQGAKTLRFSPTIDYVVSQRLRASLFFEYNKTIPAISTTFPRVNTSGGIRINFALN